jgi:hypothetical protein
MLSFANDLVTRATRYLAARYVGAGADEQRLWSVSMRGRVVGSLACDGGGWRLAWFDGADRRLAGYAGPVDCPLDGDLEALAAALSRRCGQPVQLEQLVG